MTGSKYFWYFLMTGAIGLWGISIVAGFLIFPKQPFLKWVFFLAIFLIHSFEAPFMVSRLRESGASPTVIMVKTFLFGFTWWLPFKKGIINQ